MTSQRVLLLHAYSARNAGDGLLVDHSVDVIRSAYPGASIDILASHPESFGGRFDDPLVRVLDFSWASRRRFSSDIGVVKATTYDAVVGVGGGYLRSGTPSETLKALIVHLPQLRFASRRGNHTVYLPQSMGPFRFGTRGIWRRYLRRVSTIYLRDDRSVDELAISSSRRSPDLAALNIGRRDSTPGVAALPVMSIREVHGAVPPTVLELAAKVGSYDAYIQSYGSGNDDVGATSLLMPQSIVTPEQFLDDQQVPRVVVAVRLHAALMALAAGHYVIHLAYERKGFGAFDDLGIREYVHNVNSFSAIEVERQVTALLHHDDVRRDYDRAIVAAIPQFAATRSEITRSLIAPVRGPQE